MPASKSHARTANVVVMQIVELTGLSWTGVNIASRLREAGASATLKPGTRGKMPGSRRSLCLEQEQSITQRIFDKRPEQSKMDFALWGKPSVRQHIELSLGVGAGTFTKINLFLLCEIKN